MSEGNIDLTVEMQAIEQAHADEHARTLSGILKVGAVVLSALVLVSPFGTLGWQRGLLQYGPGVVLHVGHLYWLRRGNTRTVAISHCLTYFVWVTLILAFGVGGLGAPAAFVYPPLIVVAALVWSGRGALAMAALVSAAGGLLAELQTRGLLTSREPPLTEWRLWMVMTACVAVTAALMRFALGVLERSNADRLHNAGLFDDLVRAAADAMVFVDRDLTVRAGNPALSRLLGHPQAEVIGRKLSALGLFDAVDQAALQANIVNSFEDGKQRMLELMVRAAGQAPVPVEVSLHRVADPRGARMHLSLRDISERKQSAQLQDELRKAQRLESLGRLAGGVAHDFNNLLTVILGSVELLQRKQATEEGAAIREASTRAVSLTRQLLAFGRRQVLQAEAVELNRAFEEARPLLQRLLNEEIRLEVQGSTRACYAVVDRAQLDQVMINLVVNARDAMPRGGTISLQCGHGPAPLPPESRPSAHESETVWIAVGDTGVGLTPDVRDRIFEPFFTTKAAGLGTGLGLATVHGIVAQSGGEIAVESEVGHGTRFYVTLPAGTAPVMPLPRRPVAAATSKLGRVLVVEDEPALRAVVKAMLESGGYSVTAAHSPTQALELLASAQPRFELLVTDVVMFGMSGPELARNARAKQPDLRVLFTSGHADELVEARGVLRSDVQFVAKPFMSDVLLRRVAEVLASGTAMPHGKETGT